MNCPKWKDDAASEKIPSQTTAVGMSAQRRELQIASRCHNAVRIVITTPRPSQIVAHERVQVSFSFGPDR